MSDKKLSYLFGSTSEEQVRRWVRELRIFRFCCGSQDTEEEFVAKFSCKTEDELHILFSKVGQKLNHLPPNEPEPTPGVAYSGLDIQKFRHKIPHLKHLQQPGLQVIDGAEVFIRVNKDNIEFCISRGMYAGVDENCFLAARKIEPSLFQIATHLIDPPYMSKLCVSPKNYPELFE